MNLKNAHTSKEILSDFTERIIRGTLAKYVHSKKKIHHQHNILR